MFHFPLHFVFHVRITVHAWHTSDSTHASAEHTSTEVLATVIVYSLCPIRFLTPPSKACPMQFATGLMVGQS